MTQTALIPHHHYLILEMMNIEPRDYRTVLRDLDRSGRVLYIFFKLNPFVTQDTMFINRGYTRKYMRNDGRGLSFTTSYW